MGGEGGGGSIERGRLIEDLRQFLVCVAIVRFRQEVLRVLVREISFFPLLSQNMPFTQASYPFTQASPLCTG